MSGAFNSCRPSRWRARAGKAVIAGLVFWGLWAAFVPARAAGGQPACVYSHPNWPVSLRYPDILRRSDMLEFVGPYAPSVDMAWDFITSDAGITLGAFPGLVPFGLETMATWPGRKRKITLAGGLEAFEQTNATRREYRRDIYVPHEASGTLIQLTFRGRQRAAAANGRLLAHEAAFADEIDVFLKMAQSLSFEPPDAPAADAATPGC